MVGVAFGLNKTQLALLSVYLIVAIDMFGLTLVVPVAVTYSEYLGADKSMIGFLYSAFSIGAFLSSLFIGKISDRFGRRNLFLWTLSGAFISFLGSACARSFIEFALWRSLAGIFTGTISNAMAYITDAVPHSVAPIYISYVTAVISSCFVIGPIIGGGLASFGIRVPFYSASFIASIGLIMCYIYVKDPQQYKDDKESKKSYYQSGTQEEKLSILHPNKCTPGDKSCDTPRTPAVSTPFTPKPMERYLPELRDVSPFLNPWALLVGGLGTFFNTYTYTATTILIPLFLMEHSYGIVHEGATSSESLTNLESERISLYVGYNLGVFGLAQALVMIYGFPWLTGRIGLINTGAIGGFINGIAFLFLQASKKEAHLLFIYVGMAIGNGLVRPALPAFLGMIAPPHRHGEYIAISQTFSNLAMILAGYVTQIYINDSKWHAVLIAGGCSLLNGLVMIFYEGIMIYRANKTNNITNQKSKKEIQLEERSNLEKFFGAGEELAEDEFLKDLITSIQQVIHLRGYDKISNTLKGQQIIKELVLRALPSLPDEPDERMEQIYQFYQDMGHDEWAHDLAGLVVSLKHHQHV